MATGNPFACLPTGPTTMSALAAPHVWDRAGWSLSLAEVGGSPKRRAPSRGVAIDETTPACVHIGLATSPRARST